jgi:ribosomal protein S18 acetylase RimI-like enzyme
LTIGYRPFCNFDPPALVRIWNESLTNRGAAFLHGTTPLEHYVLAKPYFDPEGLILAESDNEPVGFAHAGFGPDSTGQRLSYDVGVICLTAVRPAFRGQGVGSELLHRAEAYLRSKGARSVFFGAMHPYNPFYLGLYGGSELPGVLASDACAEPFLKANRYAVYDRCVVLGRAVDPSPAGADARFVHLRRKYELQVLPRPVSSRWFEECLLSPFELLYFQLRETKAGMTGGQSVTPPVAQPVAQAMAWDMDLFGWRWHQPTAGIVAVEVREDSRRQGIGRFLVTQVLQYLREQFFTHVEIQAMEANTAALKLYQSLGFQKVDEGRVYQLQE